MASPLKQLTKINSVDVSAYVKEWEGEDVFGDEVGVMNIKLVKTVLSAVTLSNNQTVQIWRGTTGTTSDENVFTGNIELYSQEGGWINVRAKNKLWTLMRKEVTHTYFITDSQAGKISAIFQDLVTTYGGLSADSTTIQDSGTAQTLKKFVCNHDSVFKQCKELAEAMDWQFYYKASTDKVYFEPKGFTNSSVALVVGGSSANVVEVPKWNFDVTDMVNDYTVTGSPQVVEEPAQLFNGDGATTTFTVSFEPEYTRVSVSGVSKQGQIEGSSVSADYYVDKKLKQIRFATAPAAGANNVSIIIGHSVPSVAHLQDSTSITNYGTFSKTEILLDIKSSLDAVAHGRNYLKRFSTPFKSTTLKVNRISTSSIAVGQTIGVTDNITTVGTVNGNYTINRYRIKYPAQYDELDIGDKVWRLAEWQADTSNRLYKLEQQQVQNQDYTLQAPLVGTNFRIRRKSLEIKVTAINDSFVLGHPANGILGTSKLGDRRTTTSDVTYTYF